MVIPVNELPGHLKRRIPVGGAVLTVVMLAIAIWAAVQLVTNTPDSFGWLAGANSGVTVTGSCRGDVCRGVWTDPVTDDRVEGSVHVRGELDDKPALPFFEERAKVSGATAYFGGDRNLPGFLAPVVLLMAALELLRQVVLHRRRERRRHEAIRVWRARYETA